MVNIIRLYVKILALVGMVDIIVCRPQEMKRENLVDDNRNSFRKEKDQNRNQEIIENRSVTKFGQGGKTEIEIEINNLKTQNTKSKVLLNAAKESTTAKRFRRSKRSNSWHTLADSGVYVQAWNMNCGFARRNYLEFSVNGTSINVPANCTVVSNSLILEGNLTSDSGCEVEESFEEIHPNFPVYVIKRKCEREGPDHGSGVGGKPHRCEPQFTDVRFKDASNNLITKSYESGCVLRLL